MDFLATYEVELDCGARTVQIGADEIPFGKTLKVESNDLVRMDETVRIRSRGVQRVSCHLPDLSRAGRKVLVEGVANLGNLFFIVPSLEIVTEDGSIPLTLENQGTLFRELQEVIWLRPKITNLSTQGEERLDDVKQTSDGGGNPPAWQIWQLPA